MKCPAIFFLRSPVVTRWAIRRTAFALLSFGQIALRPVAAEAQTPSAAADSSNSGYTLVAPGLLAGPAASVRFEGNGMRIREQDLVMGPGEVAGVRFPMRALMELRGGGVTTTLQGEVRKRVPGDFWEVAREEPLNLSNRGDVAVIRLLLIDDAP